MKGPEREPCAIDVTVGEIATRVAVRPSTLRCADAEREFTLDPSLASIIVVRSDGTPLLIDRASFLNEMTGRMGYGAHLNSGRLVESVVDPVATFVIPAHYTATVAYDAVLTRPASHRFGLIVVAYPDGSYGTLAAAYLLELVARISAEGALRDSLTGLANRNSLLDAISQRLMHGIDGQIGLLFIDLDRFKVVNDGLGHGAGDQLLVIVADRIRACLRAGSLAARLGGDEFAVLVDVRDGDVLRAATSCAARISLALGQPAEIAGQEVFASASIGIAVASPGESASTLLRRSDIAMYQAKRRGGGHYVFDERDDQAASRRLEIEAWLRHALTDDTLCVNYQPIVSLAGSALTGFEALVRGVHPTLGPLRPDEFLPVATEIGMLPAIDHHVLCTALNAAATWRDYSDQPLSVAVNVSAASLRDDRLLNTVPRALELYGVAPELLTLEVTESAMLQHPARTADLLDALRRIGVRIAIDDFGTGYSSLTQITTFHADILKIDRSFVNHLRNSVRDQQVVEVVIALARGMRARTVAEGIEDSEQAAILLGIGCDGGQGYLYAPALTEEEAAETVRRAATGGGLMWTQALRADAA